MKRSQFQTWGLPFLCFWKWNFLWYEIIPLYFLSLMMHYYCWLTIPEKTKICQSSKAAVYVQTLSRGKWASIAPHQMPFLTPYLNSRDLFNWKWSPKQEWLFQKTKDMRKNPHLCCRCRRTLRRDVTIAYRIIQICYQSNMMFGIFIPSSYANDPNQSNPVLLFFWYKLFCIGIWPVRLWSCRASGKACIAAVSKSPKLILCNPLSDLCRFSFHLWPSSSVGHCNRNSSRYISKRIWRTTTPLHWWSTRPFLTSNRRGCQLRYQWNNCPSIQCRLSHVWVRRERATINPWK